MNRKKIESTVRSQNLCSPAAKENKPGAVKKIAFIVRTFRMRNGRFGAGDSRNRSAGHTGCRDTFDGRLLRRADPSADLRPHDPALRAGGDLQQDHARYFPLGHPLRRSGLGRPFGRQSRRHGECFARQGSPARLLAREQPLGDNGRRRLLHLQCQVCRRACETVGRDDRLPARRRGGESPQQRAGDLHGGAGGANRRCW